MIHLPNPLSSAPKNDTSQYFVILLSENSVRAGLWTVVDGQVSIQQRSDEHPWHDEESCVNATDLSLQELGGQSDNVSQTLFALPNDWVDSQGIVLAKKTLFERMTRELSLEPIGFVVNVEAMAQFLTQNSPQLHVLLIEVGVTSVNVAMVKAGQIKETAKVGRSRESVSDLREAFAHLKEKAFPSKMVLFSAALSQEELGEVQQQLMSVDWKSSYPFLQPPVIEVFESTPFLDVILKTGGVALARSRGVLPAAPARQTLQVESRIEEATNVETVSASELGFDPMEEPKPKEELAIEPTTTKTTLQPKPVSHHTPIHEEHHVPQITSPFLKAHWLHAIIGVVTGLVLLGLIILISVNTIYAAKVTVKPRQQAVVKQATITLDSQTAASDPDKLLLKATVSQQTAEGEKTAETTGKKKVGDKAKGKVTLYNYTSSPKTFSAGTALTSGSLKFLLDEATTVASAAASVDSSNNLLTKPGSQEIAVTANTLGEESNLPTGTTFVVDAFASETYKAVSTAAFTGGSSREIQAVSKADREQLLAALKKELLEKISSESKAAGSAGVYQLPTGKVKVLSEKYSAEEGKETSSLSVTLSMQAEMMQYRAEDLQPLARQLLEKEVPSGYTLTEEAPQILSSPRTTASPSAKLSLDTNFSSTAHAVLDAEAIKKIVQGMSQQAAREELAKNTGIATATVQFSPALVGAVWQRLPTNNSRIEVVIQP